MVVLCVIAAVLLHVVVATMAVAQCPGRLTLMIASRMESGVLWVDGSHHMVMMSTNFSDNSWASLVMHVHSELHSCTKNAHAVILFFAHEARQRVIVRISGSTVVDNHRYVTPAHNDSLGPLIRPEDRIQNLTWFVTREPILITMELVDPQNGIQGHGLIASVSYDGRLIATTGDTNSKMKFTTSSPSSTWFTSQSFDDSSWSTANVNAACSVASSPPRTNLDGYNYVSVIGANGVPPQTGGGGNIAQWVGANTNCATNTIVRYRLPLDLVTLAPEPLCLPTVDPRSFLNRGVLLISNTIGPRECTTKELKVTVVVDGEHEIYVEGYAQISEALVTKKFSAIGGRDGPGLLSNNKIHTYTFNVAMGHYVIALHVRNTGANSGNRGMITLIEFDGQLFEATAPGDPHRLLWNSVEPSIGWRGTNFQDVAWPGVDTTHVCTSNPGSKVSLDYLNFAGGSPKWAWPNKCRNDNVFSDVYYRFKVYLPTVHTRPKLSCPALLPGTPFNIVACATTTVPSTFTVTTTATTAVTGSISSTVTRTTTQTVYTNAILVTAVASVTSTRTVESVSTSTVFVTEKAQTVTLTEETVTTLTGDAEVTATVLATVQNGSNNANQNPNELQLNNIWVVVGIAASGCLVTIGIAAVVLSQRQRRQRFFVAATTSGPELTNSATQSKNVAQSSAVSGAVHRNSSNVYPNGIYR